MSNISKIKISGTSYNITDENACKVVELTQAEYDELPTTAKTSNSLFVITDATAGDLSNYYTKTEADGLLDTKLDVTAYTPTDLSNYYTKSETSGATEISTALESKADTATTYTKTETDNAITAATSTKQDTLVSGTNIKTINGETLLGEGNITIQGGGGKAVSAGRGISITTGETADTVSFNLPISAGTGINALIYNSTINVASGNYSNAEGEYTTASGYYSHAEGTQTEANGDYSHSEGHYTRTTNESEHSSGVYNNSVSASTTWGNSGNTLFSVGNGKSNSARHNAFEIRQNGDIYISNTNDTSTTNYYEKPMIKLQDALSGGGGSSINVVQTTGTSTADVMSQDAVTTQLNGKGDAIGINMVGSPKKKVTFQMRRGGINGTIISSRDLTLGRGLVYGEEGFDTLSTSGLVETSAITTSVTSESTDAQVPSAKSVYDQFGGLKLVKLTKSEYDSLETKNNSTLYVIVN